jgi:hypothetical protein
MKALMFGLLTFSLISLAHALEPVYGEDGGPILKEDVEWGYDTAVEMADED